MVWPWQKGNNPNEYAVVMTALDVTTKPFKCAGVKVRPKWNWSPWYKKCFRDMMNQPHRRTHADYEAKAIQYTGFLAERLGIDISGAEHHVVNWHWLDAKDRVVKSVEFYRVIGWTRGYCSSREPDEIELITAIDIPDFDFKPEVVHFECIAAE